jgi:hypothetical protein
MKQAANLSGGEMMHGPAPKYKPSWKQVSTNLGRAVVAAIPKGRDAYHPLYGGGSQFFKEFMASRKK